MKLCCRKEGTGVSEFESFVETLHQSLSWEGGGCPDYRWRNGTNTKQSGIEPFGEEIIV